MDSEKLKLIKSTITPLGLLENPCRLCAHRCSVDRKNKKGFCNSGSQSIVYSYSPHHGEEPPLSGSRGSGTIFFAHCSMKCVYCQNYRFSQIIEPAKPISHEKLADIMLELESLGCHNINLVTPTHYAYQVAKALEIALSKSLDIPIVYNTGGYDSIELIKLMDGIVDVYLPDMRYYEGELSGKYSSAPDYPENNRKIIKEMFRQAGKLEMDQNGVAIKGVVVRLLILPNSISGTIDTLRFLKNEVSTDIYLSVMSQYQPAYKASNFSGLSRRINQEEYRAVVDEVENLGFANGWIQGFDTDCERFLGTNIKPK
jgi:putative pyruvate formate lyase activating enzyme